MKRQLNLFAVLLLLIITAVIVMNVIALGVNAPPTDNSDVSKDETSKDETPTDYFFCDGNLVALDQYKDRAISADVVVIEAGTRVATRGGNVKGPTGDTNLIMVAYIASRLDKDTYFDVTSDMLSLVPEGAKVCGLAAGDRLTMPQMIDALLVAKGSDAAQVAAVTAARLETGNRDMTALEAANSFISLMNSAAQNLSMKDTKYKNISGEYIEAQYTTAEDLLKLVSAARNDENIKAAVAKKGVMHRTYNGRELSFKNDNKLLDNSYSGYYYNKATGFMVWKLSDNCYCSIATATFDAAEVTAVLLGANEEQALYIDVQNAFYPSLSQSVLDNSSADTSN